MSPTQVIYAQMGFRVKLTEEHNNVVMYEVEQHI